MRFYLLNYNLSLPFFNSESIVFLWKARPQKIKLMLSYQLISLSIVFFRNADLPTAMPKLSRQSTSNFHPSYRIARDGKSGKASPTSKVLGDSSISHGRKRALSTGRLQFSLGGSTHPGGSTVKPNQDDYFIWKSKFDNTVVLGVLDGHGREVGDLASKTAKKAFLEECQDKETFACIRKDPVRAFKAMFARVHRAIWIEFEAHYKKNGWNVRTEGNIMMKKKDFGSWTCVHGGTTASIVVILDSHKVYVANVGDSSLVIGPRSVKIRSAEYFCDAFEKTKMDEDKDHVVSKPGVFSAEEITANHSPEEPNEYVCFFFLFFFFDALNVSLSSSLARVLYSTLHILV